MTKLKTITTTIAALLTIIVGGAVFAQAPELRSGGTPPRGDVLMLTVDSIENDRCYIMATVMTEDFVPFDYQKVPARRDSMTLEMRKPLMDAPFSVMVYEDVNMNGHLDLNDRGIPCENSAVKHCTGSEAMVRVTLRHYDK